MLWGSLFLLALTWRSAWMPWILGGLAALMHLTRADGLLWLLVAMTVFLLDWDERGRHKGRAVLSVLGGYLLVMLPWFTRNWHVFGAPLAPGGYRALLLTDYNQTFAFPASQITLASFLSKGWMALLRARLWALGRNAATAFAVQGGVLGLPFIIWGGWLFRRDVRVRAAALGWLLTFLAMTLAFPFAGARGGFFHSGAALQPFFWALLPPGLDAAVTAIRRRGWLDARARVILPALLAVVMALMTIFLVWTGVVSAPWNPAAPRYAQVEAWLDAYRPDDSPVIVANPPGYWLASGREALALPDGGADAAMRVANAFGAAYLVLEPDSYPAALAPLYQHPQDYAGWHYLTSVKDVRIYALSNP